MSKPTTPITAVAIISLAIGAFFVLQKPALPEPYINQKMKEDINKNVPFGMHTAATRPYLKPEERPTGLPNYKDALNIGVGWERPGQYASYPFDSSYFDKFYGNIPKGINILANIETPRQKGTFKLRISEQEYVNFVKNLVERYDGDGKDDMPGLKNPIKYWQIDNEPPFWQLGQVDRLSSVDPVKWIRDTKDDYAHILELASTAIKSSCSDCKLVVGGMIDIPVAFDFFEPILKKLNGKYIDVFDFHLFGGSKDDYRKSKPIYETVRKTLDNNGYKNTEIWILETGTPSGSPVDEITGQPFPGPAISEKDQASNLIKRLIYPLTFGVKKTFWAWAMVEGMSPIDNNDVFDNTGLIYDGVGENDLGYGVKKLSYYAYKKMVEILEGSDWNKIQTIQESDGIYIYKFTKQGKPIWVAWNDNSASKTIMIPGITSNQAKITESIPKYESGKEVTDYSTAFNTETKSANGGKITITLGDTPVFVEEMIAN